MNTLIVYATKHGAAEKCSKILLEKLGGKVDLCNLKQMQEIDLSKYNKIIIGGSIYAGRIQTEVTQFCINNLNILKDKKLGFFICCMNKNSGEVQLNSAFPQELLSIAVAKENFGGEFKFKEMNFFERLIIKMVSKSLAKGDSSITTVNGKEDISMLLENNINKFVKLMS